MYIKHKVKAALADSQLQQPYIHCNYDSNAVVTIIMDAAVSVIATALVTIAMTVPAAATVPATMTGIVKVTGIDTQ